VENITKYVNENDRNVPAITESKIPENDDHVRKLN